MNARYNLRAGLLPLAALICLPFAGSGAAQAAENHTGAWGLISQMGTVTPYDAIRLVLGDPVDPFVHNNLIYVNMDMQYNLPSYGQWESATWRPAPSFPTQRFPASLLGTDAYTDPMEGRYIQLRNLTIERADLDAQNVQFRFSPLPPVAGAPTSLTLKDASLTGLNPPWVLRRRQFQPDRLGRFDPQRLGQGCRLLPDHAERHPGGQADPVPDRL
jgi:hypothetical protein